jgi:hypothetical protein
MLLMPVYRLCPLVRLAKIASSRRQCPADAGHDHVEEHGGMQDRAGPVRATRHPVLAVAVSSRGGDRSERQA